ncbi:ERAD-associated protein [Cryptotrichosporon argae]
MILRYPARLYVFSLLSLLFLSSALALDDEHDEPLPDPACAALEHALDLVHSLNPHPAAHLDSKVTDAVSPFNRLGWGHEGPLSSALRMLPRVVGLVNPLRLVARAPIPDAVRGVLSGVGSLGGRGKAKVGKGRREKIERVWALLDEAEEAGCEDVWAARGDILMFPPKGIDQDLPGAYAAYERLLETSADPHAQFVLGFFHATGLANVTQDQGKAVLYYTMSALQGYKPAQMAMGYRYWTGIGVKEDCMTALEFYGSAADQAYTRFLAGPPGGETLPLSPSRLSDRVGGIYGPHASWASTGLNAQRAAVKASSAIARGETEREVLEYYQYHSDRDSHLYTVRLGRLFYLGSVYFLPGGIGSGGEAVGEIPQSFEKARAYFIKVARVMWPTDHDANGNVAPKKRMSKEMEDSVREPAMVAAAFLGRMAMRGEGQKRDYTRARLWYDRAAELGDREAHNGLGIIYRDGLAVPANAAKAYKYFQAAAGQELAEAQVNLGKHHLARGEVAQAVQLLEAALRHGSPFEAFHLLAAVHAETAQAQAQARGAQGMCGVAVAWHKLAAERGAWDDLDFVGDADRAWARGEEAKAMIGWWLAAEMGHEIGQNNVAFMLSKGVDPFGAGADKALPLWMRSAAQDNVDAMVMVGDYYYNGEHAARGVVARADASIAPPAPEADYDLALTYYQMAADTSSSALAYWNLGHMYEHALGVPRDWHLAKRFYDLALETSADAYLPWLLALTKLYAHSWLEEVRSGGRVKRLRVWDEDGQAGLWDGVKGLFRQGYADDVEDEGDGYEDLSGNGWGGGDDEDIDDLVESMLIVALGGVVMLLLWVRGRWGRIGQGQGG